ncbi:hypothetical protein [Bosea sp. (in: a-proteobacteria)]|uniref:hypothetical protein n=1 Tax=Bosea sp. (in: a-proteobacteria) TaxID=1871050 RepID=UPI003B3BA5E8
MAGYRTDPDTGERLYLDDEPQADQSDQPLPRPEAPRHGWVGNFLGGRSDDLPFRVTVRPPAGRRRVYRRKSLRR